MKVAELVDIPFGRKAGLGLVAALELLRLKKSFISVRRRNSLAFTVNWSLREHIRFAALYL